MENDQDDSSNQGLYENRLKDVTVFAEYIVAEFRRVHEPLTNAQHYDLTSLARAYFMLGNVSAGFETFNTLLQRREMPDMHDINVALSAMAEYSPRGAARMIERMIQLGMQPDSITFGTVIHFATIHRDKELIMSLISRARHVHNGQLSLKSVQALIRAGIEESISEHTLSANLERALEIIQSLTASNFGCSPDTGKYCIVASLNVGNPALAFKFWRLLVQHKIDWADTGHLILRRRMATQIRKQHKTGELSALQEQAMLIALRLEKRGNAKV